MILKIARVISTKRILKKLKTASIWSDVQKIGWARHFAFKATCVENLLTWTFVQNLCFVHVIRYTNYTKNLMRYENIEIRFIRLIIQLYENDNSLFCETRVFSLNTALSSSCYQNDRAAKQNVERLYTYIYIRNPKCTLRRYTMVGLYD